MAVSEALRKILVYRTATRVYLVARTKDRNRWRVLKLTRDTEPSELEVVADPITYTDAEVRALLSQINDGNLQHGGLKLVCTADALVGCFRFLEGYFLLLVTKKRYLGSVCGAKVYGIASSALVSLGAMDAKEGKDEQRYRKLLGGLELTKDFFYSYEYPLWRTVQTNLSSRSSPEDAWEQSNMFVWNEFLTRPLRDALGDSAWVRPLVHGFWQQRSLNVDGRAVTVTLVARRSKFFAGTRYRKRGINDEGHVANHVEVEQIVGAGFDMHTGFPLVASMVQVRGSIPLYWEHELGTRKVKPAIYLQRYDPLYTSTCLHFEELAERYGSPILVLNLVKSSEKIARESILRRELALAIKYCNKKLPEGHRVQHIPWDFKLHAKQRGGDILVDIAPVVTMALRKTAVFVCPPAPPAVVAGKTGQAPTWEPDLQLQTGVLRSNCIDCLDRTNVAQFAYGLAALGEQLHKLEVTELDAINPRSSLAAQLMDMYEQMGNVLSRQYGGSDAHSTLFQRERGSWEAATTMRDKITSLHRYYSNQFSDAERQDAINLFLGHFRPQKGAAAIWQLEHDLYLHSAPRRSLLPRIPDLPRRSSLSASGSSTSLALTVSSEITESRSGPLLEERASGCETLPSPTGPTASTPRHVFSNAQPATPQSEIQPAPSAGPQGIAPPPETRTPPPTPRADTDIQDRFNNSSSASDVGTAAVLSGTGGSGLEVKGSISAGCLDGDIVVASADDAADVFAPITPPPSPVAPRVARRDYGGSGARGVTRFRCTVNPAKRMKLESFDRKIGKQPNIMQEVRIRADPQKSYLPQWLSSPLGMATATGQPPTWGRPPIPPVRSSSSVHSSDDSEASMPVQPTPSMMDYSSVPSSPTANPSGSGVPAGRPDSARSSRSGGGLALLSGAGFRPSASGYGTPVYAPNARGVLSRANSPPAHAMGRAINAQLDLNRSLSCPVDAAPLIYPSQAFEDGVPELQGLGPENSGVLLGTVEDLAGLTQGNTEPVADGSSSSRRLSFLSMRDLWRLPGQPAASNGEGAHLQRRSASVELGQDRRRAITSGNANRSMTALDLAGVDGDTQQSAQPSRRTSASVDSPPPGPKLGMAPVQAALWSAGSASSDRVWYQDGRQTRDVYDRFIEAVAAQLEQPQSKALEEQYVSLCNPLIPISLDIGGFESGAGAAWRQQAGLVGARTFGESSLRSLVSAL